MPTTTPVFAWPVPVLGDVADGPDGFSDLALAIEATVNNANVLSYTPSWTADGSIQPVNPATRTGFYQLRRKLCYFWAQLTFGASSGGGTLPLRIGLPAPARTGMTQMFQSSIFVPGTGTFPGTGEIRSGEATCLPMFPINSSSVILGFWQSANASALPSTGVPVSNTGIHNVSNGGSIRVSGVYMTN